VAEAFPRWARKVARFKALHALRDRTRIPQEISESVLELLEGSWAEEDSTPAAPLNTIYVSLSRIYRALAFCIQRRLAQEGLSHG
jgi:hypothetical protein